LILTIFDPKHAFIAPYKGLAKEAGQQSVCMMHSVLRCGLLHQNAGVRSFNDACAVRRGVLRLRTPAQLKHFASARRVLSCSADLQEQIETSTEKKNSDWSADLESPTDRRGK